MRATPLVQVDGLVEHLFRNQARMMLSTLTRIFGPRSLDLVEDVVQEALLKALEQWPYTGVPGNPAAWLVQAAKNRAIDLVRHDAMRANRTAELLRQWAPPEQGPEGWLTSHMIVDDLLSMLFMCCHPSLPRDGRVALALRSVAGLSVREIARAFLAQDSAVAQRIVRAKRQIRDEDIAFELPAAPELPERLDSVLEVLYLWFNEGYLAHGGAELVRDELCEEAMRLCTLLTQHPATDVPKCHALLALMLLQAARFPARMNGEGDLLLLRDQDRRQWDRRLMHLGLRHLGRCAEGSTISPYHLEAGIAACHARARNYEETDWREIVALYNHVQLLKPSPIVALNRAVALSRVAGPRAGIREVEPLRGDPALARYHLLPAVLAELWAEAGATDEATRLYREALAQPCSEPERRFLSRRLAELAAG